MYLVYIVCFKIEEKEKKIVRSDYEFCVVVLVWYYKIFDVVFEIYMVGLNCLKIMILGVWVIGCIIYLCVILFLEYWYRFWFLLNLLWFVVMIVIWIDYWYGEFMDCYLNVRVMVLDVGFCCWDL